MRIPENIPVIGEYYYRRSGQTTKQVDKAIQMLFEGKFIKCTDHHENGTNYDANIRLQHLIIRRMTIEHVRVPLKVDKYKLTIEIKQS